MKRYYIPLYLSIVGICVLSSCLKDNFELKEKFSDQIEWNPSLALPIAKADLTLANIAKERKDTLEFVSETNLGYGTNAKDKVIQFKYVIDTARIVDVMHLPLIDPYDTTLQMEPVKLGTISFPIGYTTLRNLIQDNFSASDYQDYVNAGSSVTLGEKSAITEHRYSIDGLIPASLNSYILANFGETLSVHDVLEYVVLKSGKLTLSCTNSSGFEFYCDVVIGSYNDLGDYVEFSTFDYSNFPNWIGHGGPLNRISYADSSYLNGDFYFSFRNLRIAQSTNVATDLDGMGVLLNIKMEDMVAYSGKAYVPEQTLSMDTITYMTMRDEDANRKLFRVLVERGRLNYNITSTVGVATQFIAEFPTIDSFGVTPIRKIATMTNENPTYSDSWALNDCNIDLTQNPDIAYNSLPIKLGYRVQTTGGMLYFGPEQNIKIEITNPDSVVFAYVEGDLGKFEQELFNETFDFDLNEYIPDFIEGDFVFYDPKINISFHNPVGIGGDLELNLVGHDTKGSSANVFSGNPNKWTMVRPNCSLVEQGQSVNSSIVINNKTSNIVDFIKLLPNTIDYSGVFHVNSEIPDGTPIYNCISNKGEARLTVEIELPLNLSAKNLILKQDVDLDISDLGDLSVIEKMRVYINAEHQLPVKATLRLTMLDTTQPIIAQNLGVLDMIVLDSAPTKDGKVAREVKKTNEDEVTLEKGDPRLENLLKANKLRVEVLLETEQAGEIPVVFYSYYGLKLNLAADCKFIYTSK